ncbi:2-polyprenyl-6-methoxyphenol hydroxylase-like FAD-dependent oxidoreductase [Novosphingobium sp. SG751A]|uniref:FAD-dependent oxidoreductase n=1 Tax=Novosphingobium sp. SG751A TaxID=2587000 RepID=UPI00155754E6|nr:FAD-dependent oxidoreductase [Novosphingobium sp. SG751A]NOW48899.1 2-polyprenyl-6-methoxyphenol hydroxylase-like FAD-dependent oxidoreductase [Novosphingobium sp. SG751A]
MTRALIVGGGIGGMSCAITLRGLGVEVDLIDLDPQWRVYGAGITITRPSWRAFRRLGVLDELMEVGFGGDGIQICNAQGEHIGRVDDPDMQGEDLPGSGGIMRPELHRVLSSRVLSLGANVRLGLTVNALQTVGDAVNARLSDGTADTYDLVIGADGLFSGVRKLILPDAPAPTYTGQSIWRLFAPRPANIDRRHFFLGGKHKVGLSPVSSTHLYLFLPETTPRRGIIPDRELHLHLRELLQGYAGPLVELREGLSESSPIVLRPLEAFLMPPPWHNGRVLLVGDAAHPTTPHLASGAGMAVEDAIVLGEELAAAQHDVPAAFAAFTRRRWDRCRAVVENSIEIGRREQAGRPAAEQTELIAKTLALMAKPL